MIMALIYRNVGRKKTNELLLLGEQISAHEAERIGIVNKGRAPPRSSTPWWRTGPAGSPPSRRMLMRRGKDAMHQQQDLALGEAIEYLHGRSRSRSRPDDIQEGVKAFFEKREPVWTGR
jgi:enoyl-CoA hydratase/carnithine racemase